MKEPKLRGSGLPDISDASLDWSPSGREVSSDALLDGITWRRVTAFCIDFAILALIVSAIWAALWALTLLTFGLLSVLLFIPALIPVVYHSLMISGRRSATCGMQIMGIEVRATDGQRPSLLQAFAMTALFYVTITFTTLLILLVALFNDRRRCVHDILSGTIVVLSDPDL